MHSIECNAVLSNMINNKILPEGWFLANEAESKVLHAELQKELPQGHLLFGHDVEVVAHRDGATDDVLLRHIHSSGLYTVVHLTWSGRQEGDPAHPSVEVDGGWEDFLAYERGFA